MTNLLRRLSVPVLGAFALSTFLGCGRSGRSADGGDPGAWLTSGRDHRQGYYSPLDLINQSNVRQLGFAWQYEVDATEGFESTPIVVDGAMFGSGPSGVVY
jgi:glucose dehydrogenase